MIYKRGTVDIEIYLSEDCTIMLPYAMYGEEYIYFAEFEAGSGNSKLLTPKVAGE